MKGLTKYTTASGIRVMLVHYSAHPLYDPDVPENLARLRKLAARMGGMNSPEWMKEMEIRFDIQGSNRVWPNFIDVIEPAVVVEPFDIPDHWPKKAGYDYGHTNPFAYLPVAWEAQDSLYVYDEIYEKGLDIYQQGKLIRERPYHDQIQQTFADPSLWHKTQHKQSASGKTETISNAEIFESMDIYMDPGTNATGIDITFRNLLNSVFWQDLEHPKLKIFSTCKNLIRELRGLRYKEWATREARERANAPEEIVSKNNHAFDALKYLLTATMGDAPDRLDYPEQSWGALFRDMIAMQKRQEMVLG